MNHQWLIENLEFFEVPYIDVVTLDGAPPPSRRGDAVYTRTPCEVCAVMTADCLSVLFCNRAGREVAAAHAGGRKFCVGVFEQTLRADILAWLGPAIGPEAFGHLENLEFFEVPIRTIGQVRANFAVTMMAA